MIRLGSGWGATVGKVALGCAADPLSELLEAADPLLVILDAADALSMSKDFEDPLRAGWGATVDVVALGYAADPLSTCVFMNDFDEPVLLLDATAMSVLSSVTNSLRLALNPHRGAPLPYLPIT
jgi:hypothetical protein